MKNATHASAPALSVVGFSAMALLSGCAMVGDRGGVDADNYPAGSRVPVQFINSDGDATGSAILTQAPHGVLIDVELRGMPPGWHAFHVHERGRCETPDFQSAGDHFNPERDDHGYEVEDGYHAGDLPNVFVSESGRAQFQFFADRLSLGGENALLDGDGSALVVHSRSDDYRSQPSGDAGDRIACAVVQRESERLRR